jgi:serine/threonine protein kinase
MDGGAGATSMSVWNRRANEIFLDAVEQPEETRPQFVEAACSDDSGLRRLVESLLSAASRSKSFIETPMVPRPTDALEFQWSPDLPLFEGKYRLDEKVGVGGMGVVYSAMQTAPIVRRVAIKLIRNDGADRGRLARFEQERQALALMDHPNIAKIHDAGATESGQPYLVMEFIPGAPITEFCDDAKLTIEERLALFVDVCRGLHHAHQKSVIHRDLKPSNILVTDASGKPSPKLIDFGVAKVLGPRIIDRTIQTGESTLVGTLEYMAPEQAALSGAGNDVDIRCDVYSVGLILYELLTGLRAFDRDRLKKASLDEAVRILRDDDPPTLPQRLKEHSDLEKAAADRRTDPKSLSAAVTGDLDWIVQRCLAKDRERRYASANDLADDVARHLAFQPVEARPTSSLYRLRKFVRRRRGVAAAAAIVLLSLVGGTVGTTVGFIRAESAYASEARERANAEAARDYAWDALDAMTSALTGESLTAQKEVTPEQKNFLQNSLESFRRLADGRANDEKSHKRIADAARRVGTIENLLGDYQRSVGSYRTAVDGFTALAADFPDNQDYRRYLGVSLGEAGLASNRIGLTNDAEDLLSRAVAESSGLLREDPKEPKYRSDSAIHLRNLGSHYLQVGRWNDSMERLSAARELVEGLAKEFPDVDHHRTTLAACHHAMGLVEKNRKNLSEAELHFRRAIQIKGSSAPSQLDTPSTQSTLAKYHANLGKVLCEMKRLKEGVAQMRAGLVIEQRLAAQFPSRPDHRSSVAETLLNLSQHVGDLGDRIEEKRLLTSAVETFERLAADHPNAPDFQMNLAGAYCNLGIILRKEGKPIEAIGLYDKAVALLEPQVKGGRKNATAVRNLLNCFGNRGEANESASLWEAAAADYLRVVEFVSPEEARGYRIDASYCFAKAGNAKAALVELEKVGDSAALSPLNTYLRARTHALMANLEPSQRERFARLAMTGLEQAVNGGLKNAGQRLQDGALASLRERDDFKKLLKKSSERQPDAGSKPKA